MGKPDGQEGGRKRILVINDTKEILELFRDVLEGEMGHKVILMSFAPDELSRIVDVAPDLVIVDFVIGDREMEGWQLLQKMRMHPATAGIPVVACTAAVKQVRESEAYLLEQGVEVVLKPFTIAQLESAVRNGLKTVGSAWGLSPESADAAAAD
jgi:CheY-like chemotaxis protein